MSFCPICGDTAIEVFCEKHLLEKNPLITGFKPFNIIMCSSCHKIKYRTRWHDISYFKKIVFQNTVFNDKAIIQDFEVPHMPLDVIGEFEFFVMVYGSISTQIKPYEEEYDLKIPVVKSICDKCSKLKGDYFEGVLQIRNPHDEIVCFIEDHISNQPDVSITKSREVKGGFDFYFSDQKFLAQFVHVLRKKFGGEVKIQSKLHTYDHKKSKKVFRLTALLRLPTIKKGDIILTNSRLILVDNVSSTIQGFDIIRRKNTSIPCPLDDEYELMESYKTIVTSTNPQISFLNPFDYQQTTLCHNAELSIGDKIRVIRDDKGKWYLAQK